jgi:hypothetical protein
VRSRKQHGATWKERAIERDGHQVAAQLAITCDVASVEAEKDSTTYVLAVSLQLGECYHAYNLRRRFRHFDNLSSALQKSFKGAPSLPQSVRFSTNSKDKVFVQKRREAFSVFLQNILSDPVLESSDDMRSFLELTSAEQLFEKLAEKDALVYSVAVGKDEELERMRGNLKAAKSEGASHRRELAESNATISEAQVAMKAAVEARAAAELALEEERRRGAEAATAAEQQLTECETQARVEANELRASVVTAEAAVAAGQQLATELREAAAASVAAAKADAAAAVSAAAASAAAAATEHEASLASVKAAAAAAAAAAASERDEAQAQWESELASMQQALAAAQGGAAGVGAELASLRDALKVAEGGAREAAAGAQAARAAQAEAEAATTAAVAREGAAAGAAESSSRRLESAEEAARSAETAHAAQLDATRSSFDAARDQLAASHADQISTFEALNATLQEKLVAALDAQVVSEAAAAAAAADAEAGATPGRGRRDSAQEPSWLVEAAQEAGAGGEESGTPSWDMVRELRGKVSELELQRDLWKERHGALLAEAEALKQAAAAAAAVAAQREASEASGADASASAAASESAELRARLASAEARAADAEEQAAAAAAAAARASSGAPMSESAAQAEVVELREILEEARAERTVLVARLEKARGAAEAAAARAAQPGGSSLPEGPEGFVLPSGARSPDAASEAPSLGGLSAGIAASLASGMRLEQVLPSPAQALDQLVVEIPNATRLGEVDGGGGSSLKWAYCVSVEAGGVAFTVYKRYSSRSRFTYDLGEVYS